MHNNQPVSLYKAKKLGTFKVDSVPQIQLLENMGLRVGAQVTVQDRYGLDGPVLLRVEGAYELALGKDIAQQIAVKEIVV